jgi:hypothetical protein
VCALRLVVLAAGWHDRLDACLNTDAALSSLLALAGGEVQPRRNNAGVRARVRDVAAFLHADADALFIALLQVAALELVKFIKVSCRDGARSLCSPQVLSGGAVAALTALYAAGTADMGSATYALAGQLLFFIIDLERVAARAALKRCRHTLAAAAFGILSLSGANEHKLIAVELLSLLMDLEQRSQDAEGKTTWFCDALLGPMLPHLKRICSEVAPAELQAWRARFGGTAQGMSMVQQMSSMIHVRLLAWLAWSPRVAAVVKALVTPEVLAKAVEIQSSRMFEPPCSTLLRAAPLSESALRDLEERHRKQQRTFLKTEEAAETKLIITDVEAAAALAKSPLLMASRSGGLTERERTALVRAHALECREAYLSRRAAIRLNDWELIFLSGHMDTAIGDSRFPFAYTAGLHYMLRGPEMVVRANVPDVPAAVLSLLAGSLCWRAGNHELDSVSTIGAPHDGALRLITGMQLSESDAQMIPLAFEKLGSTVPPQVAAAAAKIVWRFVPFAQYGAAILRDAANDAAAKSAAMECVQGVLHGRTRVTFYTEVACTTEKAQMAMPTLVCDMAQSLSTAAGRTVLAALRSLSARQNAGADAAHGAVCSCAHCRERRACGAVCANPACTTHHDSLLLNMLKRCGRCNMVRYCSKSCQRADWGRHKPDCTPTS